MSDRSAQEQSGELVSIAMATYNGARYVRDQIESLLAQDYPIHEIVVCDDGSQDGTLDILREYESPSFRVFLNESNLGFIKNFEKACGLCEGDYIALCDQDDVWTTNKISTLVEFMQSRGLSGAFSDAFLVDAEGETLNLSLWDLSLIHI